MTAAENRKTSTESLFVVIMRNKAMKKGQMIGFSWQGLRGPCEHEVPQVNAPLDDYFHLYGKKEKWKPYKGFAIS